MTKAYIYGNGGHAHVIASFLDADVVFLVPNAPQAPHELRQADFESNNTDFAGDVFIGIGDNAARRRIFETLMGLGRPPAICIGPNTFVARNAKIGAGAVICAGAVVGARARIGANTIINTLSSVDHDCILGAHSQITAGVTIGGGTHIGEACFFGIKSAAIPGIKIGNNVQVMAGSLVTKPMPNNILIGGSPAKVMRNLT